MRFWLRDSSAELSFIVDIGCYKKSIDMTTCVICGSKRWKTNCKKCDQPICSDCTLKIFNQGVHSGGTVTGKLDVKERMRIDSFRDHWLRLQKKYGLPHLRPKDLRHWVSTVCRKVGLSKPATAFLQGHDASGGGAMRDWYDNPQLEERLEEQESCLPRGPLGLLMAPLVEIDSDRPSEALAILDAYLAGETGTMEFASSMEVFRMRMLLKPSV